MTSYLLPEDDGLPIRVFGDWTSLKLDYLERYINIFEQSMRQKPWRQRNYIDLFAGAGKFRTEEKGDEFFGSPLLALTTKYPFTNYYFVDSIKANIDALKLRSSNSPFLINYYIGDANFVVKDIVSEISAIDSQKIPWKWSSLNLAFLDPDGLEVRWDTVKELARLYSMDLIIYYSQYGLNINFKNCYNAKGETDIDLFFGNTEWRKIYEKWQVKESISGIHRELIDHYKQNLHSLGYVDIFEQEPGVEPLMRNTKQAPLYRLIFASKNKRGNDFWKKVTDRDLYGNKRLL
jgi:three-Cys-motif partner protein